MAYFINPSHQYVCVCTFPIVARQRLGKVYPPFVARQRLGKHVPGATNTRKNRRIVGRVIFYAINVLSKESMCFCPASEAVDSVEIVSELVKRLILDRGWERRVCVD
jgi:hypothetical protein